MKRLINGYVCAQSCPTLCDPMYYNPPGSSVHGILQARIGELPHPGIEPESLVLAGRFFTTEPPGMPCLMGTSF